MKITLSICFAVAAFALVTGHATEASAQATRTWVSGVGDDANPCSRTAPCKTFAGAISKTATDGIIDIIDPGAFGTLTITKGITVRATGLEAGVLGSGTQGIVINAGTANVALIGLTIDGVNTGTNGVNVINAGQVTIRNCQIAKFNTGLFVNSSAYTRVLLTDSLIYANTRGVVVTPTSSGGPLNGVAIENSVIDANSTGNIVADSASAQVTLRRSSVLSAPITLTNGAQLRSFGDNAIAGGGSAPTQLLPLQ